MPIPTDTFWNIKRLNRIFFLSVLAMLVTFIWAVMQDYDKFWRKVQREGRAWEAALIDQRVHSSMTPEIKAHVAALTKQIADDEAALAANKDYAALDAQIAKFQGDIAYLNVDYNNIKAEVTVQDAQIEQAHAAGDLKEMQRLQDEIKDKRQKVEHEANEIAADKLALSDARAKEAVLRTDVDKLVKERKGLTDTVQALEKKEQLLEPTSFLGTLSAAVRAMPLMQFINPSERVQQIVLPDIRMDVSFTRIDTIDRCTTCHVHIGDKRFTKEKVLTYLEEETAAARGYRYVSEEHAKATDATSLTPGATADPVFWHYWGRRLLSPAALAKTASQIKSIAGAAAKLPDPSPLLQRHAKLATEKPSTRPSDDGQSDEYDQAIVEIITRLYSYDPSDPVLKKTPALASARANALIYPERLRDMLKAELSANEYKELEDRYRFELVGIVNKARAQKGYPLLDPSPVELAHPNLALYVDVDSPHNMDAIGCTSCHDGSGNETDFVLASHVARPIWVDEKSGEPVLSGQLVNPPKLSDEPTLANMLEAVWPQGQAIPVGLSSLHLDLTQGETKPKIETKPADAAPVTEYFDPVTGNKGKAISQAKYWANTYEDEAHITFEMARDMWDYPMRPADYIQSNCARCHNNFNDIRDEAPELYKGRQLFAKLGCVDCHQMDSIPADDPADPHSGDKRQVGTDLRHVAGKLSPEFINTWIWAPKAFRPSTQMPHFFMAENSSSDEELRRTRQETRAITEYLVESSTPWEIKQTIPAGIKGDAQRGSALFEQIGCMGCHTNLNHIPTGKKESVGEQWITLDLEKRLGYKRPQAKAAFDQMTYNQRQFYALENLGEISTLAEQPKYPDGTSKPVFMHFGPELSGIGDKLTAGRSVETARAWLYDWLKEPRHYSAYTVMPRLRLDDQQAADLAAYLLGQHRDNVPTLDAESKPVVDSWKATLFEPDPQKLTEMTSFFLASLYGDEIAAKQAGDVVEMTNRATDVLTTAFEAQINNDPSKKSLLPAQKTGMASDRARQVVKDMPLERKQMVYLGYKLINFYGCMNCHGINGLDNAASPCANLSDWGQKGVEKLDFGYLDEHKVHDMAHIEDIPMVNGLCVAAVDQIGEAFAGKDFTKSLSTKVAVAWPQVEATREAWLEQKLENTRVWDRGRGNLEPVRQVGADGKPALDKAGYPEIAYHGKPYEKLKMPNFYLNDEQIHELTTFVVSNRARLISDKLLATVNNEEAVRIARGRQITERFNCVSCHVIDANFPEVRQYYASDDWNGLAPPSLRGEGNKIQFSWLYDFIHNVVPIRPLPQIRMPTFPISDDEVRSVAAYFAASSNHESKTLAHHFDTVNKEISQAVVAELGTTPSIPDDLSKLTADEAKAKYDALMKHAGAQLAVHDWDQAGATLTQAQKVAAAANLMDDSGSSCADALNDALASVKDDKVPDIVPFPDDDWYKQDKFALDAAYLRKWAISNEVEPELIFNPAKNSPQELGKNYRDALFMANFVTDLYAAPYPFVDVTRPEISEDEYHRGENFFIEMQCLKCHIFGDAKAPGTLQSPPAPNLALAYVRLQPRWIERWVQEPYLMQINTKMPAFFSGRGAFKLDGQAFPLALGGQSGTVEATKKIMEKYHTSNSRDQRDLLVNFLFEAGKRGATVVQPPETAPATQPATSASSN